MQRNLGGSPESCGGCGPLEGTGTPRVTYNAGEGVLSAPSRNSMYSPGGAITAFGGICTVNVPLRCFWPPTFWEVVGD